MIKNIISESTEVEFKSSVEKKRPKSWLKTVSAFANGIGGKIFFGIDDDKITIGVVDVNSDCDFISNAIKEKITPVPDFNLNTKQYSDGKNIIILNVSKGFNTPYFYKSDGICQPFIRVGNQSNPASDATLKELLLKGNNLTFDGLPSRYNYNDLSFTVFEQEYKKIRKKIPTLKEFISFEMCDSNGIMTYAGLLFADNCPLRQARVFCTHWDGLEKGSSIENDAIDHNEIKGDILSLLKQSHNFVRMNSKVRFKKMEDYRINKPDYAFRAVFEALVNAIMHRDWSIIGSEIHVDIYDNRLDIYSPGGMLGDKAIQDLNIENVPSKRRNPILADILYRLNYVEREGIGLKLIRDETQNLFGYNDSLAAQFLSNESDFHVILMNMNYQIARNGQNISFAENTQDDELKNRTFSLLEFCSIPRTRSEMQTFVKINAREYFRKNVLVPLLQTGLIKMTIPNNPNDPKQKYVKA
ncbi:MAG: putative DNA binding domain-containing protein [Deltaproteobacteria bacterium]|jgi:ATP-dependent DNA helicase RecG|nr:putative DNA binding domain-containing protein [Deltaproteobacteria bacterium]